MNRNQRLVVGIAALTLELWFAFHLAGTGIYGVTLFVMLPVTAGALVTWILRPATLGDAAKLGAITGAVGCGLFLVLGKEGLQCVFMALPAVVPLATIGSLLAQGSRAIAERKRTASMVLLLPAGMLFDWNATPPVYSVSTSVVVNAAPQRVWKNVVAFPPIKSDRDWLLQSGVAYPLQTRVSGVGVGAARSCDLSTGTMAERVLVWDQPRLLKFAVLSTPPAMEERGLYGPIHPKHLNGYYISKEGQFELQPLSGGRTLVTGTSWYQHGLWPASYWRLWSDAVVHHIHRRVLEHIRVLSETETSQQSATAPE